MDGPGKGEWARMRADKGDDRPRRRWTRNKTVQTGEDALVGGG